MRKRRAVAVLFSASFILVSFSIVFIKSNYVVPIIMYHSVNPDAKRENRLAVTPQAFERQMSFLKRHNYNVLPLEKLAALIKQKQKIPSKTIAITLDDGYKDNYTYAFPILKKYNLTANIFVIYNEVERPQNDRLSWPEIKEMQSSGLIYFGSHTLGPEPLINIKSRAEIKRQIFESKKALEKKLGQAVIMFSYPEGRFTPIIRQLVIDAGYQLAVATSPGKNFPNNDVFALKRLRISENAKNLFVFWFETTGFYTFIKEHRRK